MLSLYLYHQLYYQQHPSQLLYYVYHQIFGYLYQITNDYFYYCITCNFSSNSLSLVNRMICQIEKLLEKLSEPHKCSMQSEQACQACGTIGEEGCTYSEPQSTHNGDTVEVDLTTNKITRIIPQSTEKEQTEPTILSRLMKQLANTQARHKMLKYAFYK